MRSVPCHHLYCQRGLPYNPHVCLHVCVCVQEEGWEDTAEMLDDLFLGDAELWR